MDSELSRLPDEPRDRHDCRRPDLGQALVRFDELTPAQRAELEAHAAACPICGPRLERLTRAQRWLDAQSRPPSACPPADELYDFGHGPGARALSPARRAELVEHVDRCPPCRSFVATLATAPPVSLEGEPAPVAAPASRGERPASRPTAPAARPSPVPPAWRRRAGWAAAAAVLIALGLWSQLGSDPRGTALGYPELEVHRSSERSQLVFPRGPVALDPRTSAPLHALEFELAPHDPADRFRIVLRRHDGGAFDAGEVVAELEGTEPRIAADGVAWEPGHYTWSAWSVIDGLELPLGERDFELRVVPELDELRAELADVAEPERSFRRLHWLVERGFATDARQLARRLPPGPERDEFLERQAER